MDDPRERPELFHPELRDKTRTWLVLRSSMWSKWWYPEDQQVGWYGGLKRDDGGNGMYATPPQAVEWVQQSRVVVPGDIKAGPG